MSEYQYHEFCRLNSPLPAEARKEMATLSSRASIGTHSVSYVYNYGDFRGDAKQLLSKYFDVYFYISNWGNVRLMFKYGNNDIDPEELDKYYIKYDVVEFEQCNDFSLLDINITMEEGGTWVEGNWH